MSAALLSFLRWWWAELAGMLPERMRAGAIRYELVPGPSGVSLTRAQGGAGRVMETRPAAQASALLARLPPGARVALRWTGGQPFHLLLTLPAVAAASLEESVMFALDGQFPLPLGQLRLAWQVLATDRAAQRIRVGVSALPEGAAEAALAWLRAHGLPPLPLLLPGDGEIPDCLLSADARSRPKPRARRALAAVAALLLVAVLLVPLVRLQRARAQLDARLHATEARIALLRARVARQASAQAGARFLARRRARPPISLVLATLARVLPDNTWLVSLRITGRALRLEGETQAAGPLIGRLDGDPMFTDAAFAGPITRNGADNTTSFVIVAQLRRAVP
ncbi:MAG: PilN domain-containing protein [Acetobacteraceae bacterium]